jgi:A/G-specific adenine glycosylase
MAHPEYVIISRLVRAVNHQLHAPQAIRITIRSAMESTQPRIRRLPQLRRELLAWYDDNQRDLPWRSTRDPYRIWISEIMLQQTRVAAVLPRYEKFLCRFPSVEKLASAQLASVLAEWSGLGYYRRARNLHAAAKVIARERNGNFPESSEEWRKLAGIGRYTSAAIASIALNESVAVLDGNVERVLRRLLHRTQSSSRSWNTAQELLDRERPGDFNQAMMELGATVCLPGEPSCTRCPITGFCRTRGRGESQSRKPRQIKSSISVALVTKGDCVLLVRRRSNENLMSGMWELPTLSRSVGSENVLFRVRHSITVTDYVVSVVAQSGVATEGAEWISQRKAQKLPLTGLTKKILRKANIIQ